MADGAWRSVTSDPILLAPGIALTPPRALRWPGGIRVSVPSGAGGSALAAILCFLIAAGASMCAFFAAALPVARLVPARVRQGRGKKLWFAAGLVSTPPLLGLLPEAWLRALKTQPEGITAVIFTAFVAFLVAGCSQREGLRHFIVAVGTYLAGYGGIFLVRWFPFSPPPVHTALGFASYTGYARSRDTWAVLAMMVAAVLVAAVAARFARAPLWGDDGAVRGGRSEYAAWIAGALLIAAFSVPPLASQATWILARQFAADNWDATLITTWQYLIHQGALPIRDFWYPYQGFWLMLAAFPYGALMWGVHNFICLFGMLAGLMYVVRPVRAAVALFLLFVAALQIGNFQANSRYVLAIIVGLVYLGIDRERRRWQWSHAIFAVMVTYVFFMEFVQVLYALVGMAAHSAYRLWSRFQVHRVRDLWTPEVRAELAARLRYEAAPAVAGIAGVMAYMESRGQLRDFLSHAVSLADQAAYVALPAGVTTWLRPVPAPEWIIVAGAILLALGCYETFRPQAREGHRVADALMVLGFMFALCVQKQVLRPHIAIQLIVYALVGSLLYAVLIRRRWTPAQSVAAGLFCGALLALYAGALLGVARTITRSPAELVSNWRVWNDRELRGRVNSEMFARSRFAAFKDATATVDVLERELGYTREDRAYVMGDDSFFYSLLGQDAPYNINHYSSSPIYEQRRVVDWLVRRRPRYVLWNPAVSIFDGVPHSVRVPLIYQHVVEHYAYLRSSGVYDILVRRNADAPMDSAYWRRRVGEMVDLGHVPRLSRVVSAPACTGGECAEVALVRLPAVEWRRKTSLRLMTDAGEFVVMFDVEPGVKEYATRLDRLWFWPLIRDRNGVSAALNERGLVERVRRHAADQLY